MGSKWEEVVVFPLTLIWKKPARLRNEELQQNHCIIYTLYL